MERIFHRSNSRHTERSSFFRCLLYTLCQLARLVGVCTVMHFSFPRRYRQPFSVRESKGDGEDEDKIFRGSRKSPLLVIPLDGLSDEAELDEEDDNKCGPIGMEAVEQSPSPSEVISPPYNFLLACLAGILASILTHPFDVIRTQMQLWGYQPGGNSLVTVPTQPQLDPGSIDRILRLPQDSGGNRAIIEASASAPTVSTPASRLRVHVPPALPSASKPISIGAQNEMPRTTAAPKIGLLRFSYNLYKTEGKSVFWRGLGPRIARRTIATALAWTAFEELNQRFIQGFGTGHDPTSIRRDY